MVYQQATQYAQAPTLFRGRANGSFADVSTADVLLRLREQLADVMARRMSHPDQGLKVFDSKISAIRLSKKLSKYFLDGLPWAKVFEPRAWADDED